MAGRTVHMERAHRNASKKVDYSGFERKAYQKKLSADSRKPQSLISKVLGGLRKKQDR